jgi:hypothetical protein
MDENAGRTILSCTMSFEFSTGMASFLEGKEAKTHLEKDKMLICPQYDEPLLIIYRDISELKREDYKIKISLYSGEEIMLFHLGRWSDDFWRILNELRNEIILKDYLMQEKLVLKGIKAHVDYGFEDGRKIMQSPGEVRLYETGLVLMPEEGDIVRIPYSDFSQFSAENYGITVETEFGENIRLSKMGQQFELFKRELSELRNELARKAHELVREVWPEASLMAARNTARFLKDGKATDRSTLHAISPVLWNNLEKKLQESGIKEEYDFLINYVGHQQVYIGLKRGLMGTLTGNYIWFMIPIYSLTGKEPGNAVALEAAAGEGGGKATYFFRITDRETYGTFTSMEELHKESAQCIKEISRCLLDINFRREPIYLSYDKIMEPPYDRYKRAVEKTSSLKMLRSRFIGRVIHTSKGKWEQDVIALLAFNVSTNDNNARWEGTKQ